MSAQERSASRSRDAFKSTGRGGVGNMQRTSNSKDTHPESGPDDYSITRGREPFASPASKVYTTGRGGAGNLQYTSQVNKADTSLTDAERDVILEHLNAQENANFSSGRGGLGNFANRSRSREPASAPNLYSSGRGGAGNIFTGEVKVIGVIDEEERKQHQAHSNTEGYRSIGRGGSANFQAGQEPPVERPTFPASEYESSGRGGSGNIIQNDRTKSSSRRQE